ncbi:MAG: AAA family ATPase [Desulfobulbus sp.]
MGYEPLVQQNPLRVLDMNGANNQMGLIMARAGLGKTALLVQIALDAILRGKQVIHVSIGESIEKTKTWYSDILSLIVQDYSNSQQQELTDLVARNRMIMTFNVSAFSRTRLEERLNDLVLQDIFRPNCLIIDGFNFVETDREALEDLKNLMETMGMQTWFSAISHRGDARVSPTGVPAPCHEIDDLFDTIILLRPEADSTIQLDIIRNDGELVQGGRGLRLDPTTMMVKEM